jgi:PAS domain S-box-containing protein
MTSPGDSSEFDLVFSETGESRPADTRRLVIRTVLAIVSLAVVAAGVVYWAVSNRERELYSDLRQRTEIFSATRAEVVKGWLDSLGSAGLRFSRSDLFRLFAAEVSLGGVPAQGSPLSAQLPYMIQAVTEFARQERLSGVYLVDKEGRAVLASGGAPGLTEAQRSAAVSVFEGRARRVTPARASGDGLVLDVLLPVAPPQEENPATPAEVAGVFVLATPVRAALTRFLEPSPLAGPGERTRLLQLDDGGLREIDPRGQPPLSEAGAGEAVDAGAPLSFGRRPSLAGAGEVFSAGAWIAGVPWLVVHEIEADLALEPLRAFTLAGIGFAALVTLLLLAALLAMWWRQASEQSQALADQYRELGGRINAQRRFLDSLMRTVTEMVGLKSRTGSYVYVNPSFAEAVGRAREEVTGQDDAAVFGRGTATRLHRSDEQVLESGKPIVVEEQIHLPAGARFLQLSKVPYRGERGDVEGILTVARDVTELREAEQKRQRALQDMTRALVRTIEQVDPFLGGHSQNVHDVGVALAKGLGMSQDEVTTVDIAAMLAQIGKVSVPKEIVAKEGRLSPEELRVMQSHVGHAVRILEQVEFGLPVVDAISQMYERLDGSGYPKGLSDGEVSALARVLAVADVFCARIEPRSYRGAITSEETLTVLEEHPERYDEKVVAALRGFVHSVEGEKIVARVRGE